MFAWVSVGSGPSIENRLHERECTCRYRWQSGNWWGICRLPGERGWYVCVNDTNAAEEAHRVVSDIEQSGSRAIAIRADAVDEEAVEGMFRTVDEKLGQETGLVNNAGIMGSRGRNEQIDVAATLSMFAVNITP